VRGHDEENPSDLLSLEKLRFLLPHCAQDEDFAGETKGSLTSGFEWARHHPAATFRVAPIMTSAEQWKNLMYPHGYNSGCRNR
jgi:hypothetical protein